MLDIGTSESSLTFRIDNTRPVEISDLGRSLQALGKQFEEFVVSHGYDQTPANTQLFVSHLETGSIIVTLKAFLDHASFVLKLADVFAGFVGNIHDIIDSLIQLGFLSGQASSGQASGGPSALPPVTRGDAERIYAILDPVAKDSGSKLSITVTGNTAPVTVIVNSEKANATQNAARRFLGPGPKFLALPTLPTEGQFEREVMYLQQMRGDPKSQVGDRGVIEKFSPKPVKLHFMTPAVKASILENSENPFKMAYVVDGQLSTVEGKPALYKVAAVHDAFERP